MPVQAKINIRSTSAPRNISQRPLAMSLNNQMGFDSGKRPVQQKAALNFNQFQMNNTTAAQTPQKLEMGSQFKDLVQNQPAQKMDTFTQKPTPLMQAPKVPQNQFTNISNVTHREAFEDASVQINAFQKRFQDQLEKLHLGKYMNQKGQTQNVNQMNTEAGNTFNIQNNSGLESNKTFENFMDISIKNQPKQIMEDIHRAFTEIMSNPNFKPMKNSLAALALSLTLLQNPTPAMADVAVAEAQQPVAVGYSQQNVLRGNVSYSAFINAVKNDQIVAVNVADNGREAAFKSVGGGVGKFQIVPDPDFFQIMKDNNVDLSVTRADPNAGQYGQLLTSFGIPLLLVGLYFVFSRNSTMGLGGGVGQMGKSKARIQTEPETGVNFDAVAGVDEAKQELAEIVDFLKNP